MQWYSYLAARHDLRLFMLNYVLLTTEDPSLLAAKLRPFCLVSTFKNEGILVGGGLAWGIRAYGLPICGHVHCDQIVGLVRGGGSSLLVFSASARRVVARCDVGASVQIRILLLQTRILLQCRIIDICHSVGFLVM